MPARGYASARALVRLLHNTGKLDAPRGFEPRLTVSETVVLPLDDRAAGACL